MTPGRRSRAAGAALIVGTTGFVTGMIVAQIGYGSSYSLSNNLISDLGVTACGVVDGTGRYACSPWWAVFDGTLALLGLLVLAAMILLRSELEPGVTSDLAAGLVGLNGLGVLGAALSPENVDYGAHSALALIAFAAGAAGLVLMSLALRPSARWGGAVRAYSLVGGIVSGGALLLFVAGIDLGLGPGGMERLLVAPVLLWFLWVGGVLLARGTSELAGGAGVSHTPP